MSDASPALAFPKPGRLKAILFDLDGTLIDSAPDLSDAVNRLLDEIGRPRVDEAEVRLMVGDGFAKLMERALEITGGLPSEREIETLRAMGLSYYLAGATERTTVYPGAAESLRALSDAGWRLALCTNKPYAPTAEILKELDLAPYFEAIGAGDSYAVKKPDPGHVLALLGELGVSPQDALMIGDSRNDVEAAKNAGLATIAVTFGYSREPVAELGADRLIDGFPELAKALAELA